MHKADLPKYMVYGYSSQQQLDNGRGCDDEIGVDTLKEAKAKAKYIMTDEYMNTVEASRPIVIVQIFKGDECVDEVRAA